MTEERHTSLELIRDHEKARREREEGAIALPVWTDRGELKPAVRSLLEPVWRLINPWRGKE